jgi:hypothetical protein
LAISEKYRLPSVAKTATVAARGRAMLDIAASKFAAWFDFLETNQRIQTRTDPARATRARNEVNTCMASTFMFKNCSEAGLNATSQELVNKRYYRV